MSNTNWPPDYKQVIKSRIDRLTLLRSSPDFIQASKLVYEREPYRFIVDWSITYDPRKAAQRLPAKMPFIPFSRQRDLVAFLESCLSDQEDGLIEKCRDMGATWICCAYSVALWLFRPGAAIGWGSRKEQLVDRLGDPDSIFEKMRMILRGSPPELLPIGFSWKDHATYMKFINPENGNTITGEAGDNIGRGGRKTIYFKDESAHYERPELIEAALGDNTDVQIDISSVNGIGNVFYRRRQSGIEWKPGLDIPRGKTRVFVMDWRDHPEKDESWYERRRQKAEDDGLLHIFAQEVDRDYSAAVEGTIIPAEWVRAAIDAHVKLDWTETSEQWFAGLDVADGGGDRNAFMARQGPILRRADMWGARDTAITTRRAIDHCRQIGAAVDVQYDCIGVGSGVKAEVNRLLDDETMPARVKFIPWNAGADVLKPHQRVSPNDRESPKNKEIFGNLKAQAWWSLRLRFQRTYRAVTKGETFEPDDMISLDSSLPYLNTLVQELSQPTRTTNSRLKMIVDKAPDGAPSPNLADGVVMCYFPVNNPASVALISVYGS